VDHLLCQTGTLVLMRSSAAARMRRKVGLRKVSQRRPFRLSLVKGKGFVDFEAAHGAVMRWETNRTAPQSRPCQHWAADIGRRISITAPPFDG